MSISNIQATKFFDEVRTYFAPQAQAGKPINLVVAAGKRADGATYIGIFDDNNNEAIPMVLMLSRLGTGRRWSNELSTSGEAYNIVNFALAAFDKKKEEWASKNTAFQLEDAINFLVDFMKQVSGSLY